MLKQRIITAVLLLPLVLAVFYWARLDAFVAAIAVAVYLIGLEWGKVAGLTHLTASGYAMLVSTINLAMWFFQPQVEFWPAVSWPQHITADAPAIALLVGLLMIGISLFIVLRYSAQRQWWSASWIKLVFGLLLLPGYFVALVSIRAVEWLSDYYYGGHLLLFMFCLIWAADTGAYTAGKLLGRHKLAPKVSPNKSIEGAVGGILLSIIIAIVGANILNLPITSWPVYVSFALLMAVLSVFGDLFESALKRDGGVKDSGNLLPGHGGLLDRLDSSLVVAPVYYVGFSLLGWF